jgi:7,8-dihydro-6-hydroxymethylpterin-pyrophosphokinase
MGKNRSAIISNQALEISTSLNARQLMRKILKIEKDMGRIRKESWTTYHRY